MKMIGIEHSKLTLFSLLYTCHGTSYLVNSSTKSILVTHSLAGGQFSEFIEHLIFNYLIKFFKRMALNFPIASPSSPSTTDGLAHLPNMEIVDVQPTSAPSILPLYGHK
jgi:hypothetical protein